VELAPEIDHVVEEALIPSDLVQLEGTKSGLMMMSRSLPTLRHPSPPTRPLFRLCHL
jgi:hypothetical protein